ALFSARIVQPKPGERWILVTSAAHMPRSVGCFREAGFEVIAHPVDYRARGWMDATRVNSFASDGLLTLDLAVK
ncbi:YdcF family protein, partial [Stenotrophomonas maltophilia]